METQRTTEIVLRRGDEQAYTITPKDSEGDTIDLTGYSAGQITDLKFEAYEYWTDTAAYMTIASTVHTIGLGDIVLSPTASESSGLAAGSYLYQVTATLNGVERVLLRDQITLV